MTKFDELEQLYHQPHRLEIMAELCGAEDGRTFVELKDSCALTDGNLSRHLQALEKAGAVKIKKSFVDSKPQTTIVVSPKGRDSFIAYLEALEQVLKSAAKRSGVEVSSRNIMPSRMKPAKS